MLFASTSRLIGTRRLIAQARTGFQSSRGKFFFGSSAVLGIGWFSPVAARSLWSERTSETCPLVPREKAESKFHTTPETSPAYVFLRVCFLLYTFIPVVLASPLLFLSNEDAHTWVYQLLREKLSQAGPLFIKWGQWASTRYDMLPLSLCNELNLLTQSAPHHSWDHTERMLREEFKGDYTRSLQIDREVIASGSVAQTYKGMLGDKKVAIKVQHPNIRGVMEADTIVVERACHMVDDLLGTYLVDVFRQFALHLNEQLDFRLEKRNLERFEKNFQFWRFVCFPKPHTASEKILVETFEPGHSIIEYLRAGQSGHLSTDVVTPEARKQVCSVGIAAVLKMIMSDNFVHADLHPGNILIRPAPIPTNVFSRLKQRMEGAYFGFHNIRLDDMPQVCFLDGGMTAAVDPRFRPDIQEVFKSMLDYDGGRLANAILSLSTDDVQYSSEEATSFVEQMRSTARTWSARAWNLDHRTGDCMKEALNIVRENGIRLDNAIMIPILSAVTLEGWQYELDPTISVMNQVQQQINREDFFTHLSTRVARSMWKSAEANIGLDEDAPPSWCLSEECAQLTHAVTRDCV